ncbi:MAG: SCP2 sterol-binding domain-containing protein [Actinomycetota bacterium]|nr:SCP2 sterol-binding domain-containing protein [Actinomycetota bacterium]
MALFLSDDHFEAANQALNSDSGFLNAIVGVDLAVQFDVSGTPNGDVSYHLIVKDGTVGTGMGSSDAADVSVASDFETSKAISKGELNVQMAFMSGKIKVGGNMAKIMMHQAVINDYARVLSGLDVEY